MDWTRPIDAYCERLGPEYWAEPLNALSNAAFLVAAGLALWLAVRRRRLDPPMIVLITLATTIGIGSYLFHTLATAWAALADVLPIMLFIFVYFAIAMRCFLGLPRWAAGLATLAYIAFSFGFEWLVGALVGHALHGSEGYLPALIGLLAVGAWLGARRHPAGRWLFAAAGVFAVSLFFRTIDEPVCPSFPLGTHFLWHLLNGTVIGIVLVAMIRHGTPALRPRTGHPPLSGGHGYR